MLALLFSVTLAMSLSPAAVPRVEQIARILAPLTDLRALSTEGPGTWCSGEKDDVLWLAVEQEHASGLDCLLQAGVAPRCSVSGRSIKKRRRPTCPPPNGGVPLPPAPDWVTRLAPLLLDEDEPINIQLVEGGPGLHLTHSLNHYIMIRAATGWLLLPESIGLSDLDHPRNKLRIMETSQMTHTPSWGVIAAFYDGGNGLGEADTQLYIVVPESGSLRVLARRTIGVFRWVSAEEDRPDNPFARRRRAEVAVTLQPTFTPEGVLHLRLIEKSLGQLSQFCSRQEIANRRAMESEICPLPLLMQVRDDKGAWQFSGDKWVRVTAAASRRPSPGL